MTGKGAKMRDVSHRHQPGPCTVLFLHPPQESVCFPHRIPATVPPTSHANPSFLNLLRNRMHKLLKPWQALSGSLSPQTTAKIENVVQGISKRLFLGCVKSGEKVEFCSHFAGRETQYFHHIFSQPGKSLSEFPCTGERRMGRTETASRMMR